jgi:hypothetical protein
MHLSYNHCYYDFTNTTAYQMQPSPGPFIDGRNLIVYLSVIVI